MAPMTFDEWRTRTQALQARADKLRWSIWARANDYALQAGLGQQRNVWHNAMIARSEGRPWAEVNYSLLRRAIREDARMFDAHHIVDRWSRRAWALISR